VDEELQRLLAEMEGWRQYQLVKECLYQMSILVRWNDPPDVESWFWNDVFSDDDDQDATVLFTMLS
jgi:heme-degrading monooxygenase HmoA